MRPPPPMEPATYEAILAAGVGLPRSRSPSLSHLPRHRSTEEQRAEHAAIPGGTAQRRGTQYTAAELKLREDFARCVLQHLALFHLPLGCLLLLAS